MEKAELLPIVDEIGNVVGSATRERCHCGEKVLHPVVHLHVFDSVGRLLLQRRSMSKKIQPGKWDTAVGGHVDYGEAIIDALRREVAEEIGLNEFIPEAVCNYVFESDVERELINCFRTVAPEGYTPVREASDIDELAFFTRSEILRMIANGETTPNFAQEFNRFFES